MGIDAEKLPLLILVLPGISADAHMPDTMSAVLADAAADGRGGEGVRKIKYVIDTPKAPEIATLGLFNRIKQVAKQIANIRFD